MNTVTVRARPILFSGPMVRAILEGRKTQTRRVVKWAAYPDGSGRADGIEESEKYAVWAVWKNGEWVDSITCPYGAPGDRLWVRENHYQPEAETSRCALYLDGTTKTVTAGGVTMLGDDALAKLVDAPHGISRERYEKNRGKLIPSIHMPRWASRITLEVTGVRVERLQEISEDDAKEEGFDAIPDGPIPEGTCGDDGTEIYPGISAKCSFRDSWDALNAKRGFSWEANPWVWVVSFKKLESAEGGKCPTA